MDKLKLIKLGIFIIAVAAAVVLATNIVSRVSEQKQILAVAEQTALEKATEEYGEGCYVFGSYLDTWEKDEVTSSFKRKNFIVDIVTGNKTMLRYEVRYYIYQDGSVGCYAYKTIVKTKNPNDL
ncbi:MAG: hypothetical protein ACI4DY_12585 [Monoglobaceae bacterium]